MRLLTKQLAGWVLMISPASATLVTFVFRWKFSCCKLARGLKTLLFSSVGWFWMMNCRTLSLCKTHFTNFLRTHSKNAWFLEEAFRIDITSSNAHTYIRLHLPTLSVLQQWLRPCVEATSNWFCTHFLFQTTIVSDVEPGDKKPPVRFACPEPVCWSVTCWWC